MSLYSGKRYISYICQVQNHGINMIIQRPQALYLLLCSFLAMAAVLWGFSNTFLAANTLSKDLMYVSAGVALLTVFLFKHLKWQAVLAKTVLIINAIVLVIFVFRGLNLSGGASSPEKGIEAQGLLLLFASMVAALAASRAIKRDLRIVKSADRLR